MADWLGLRGAQARRDEMAEEPKEAAPPSKGVMSQADFFKKPEETAEVKAARAKKLAALLRSQ